MLKIIKILGLVVYLSSAIANVSLAFQESSFFVVKLGFDQAGKHDVDNASPSFKPEVNNGFAVGAEWQQTISNHTVIGLGINHQSRRQIKNYLSEFNFSSVYAIAKLKANDALFFVGRLGHNSFQGNEAYKDSSTLEGGSYYAVGLGIIDTRLETELLYEVNNGKIDNLDITYSKILITIGYKI